MRGSLTQRYVKRHGRARTSREIRPLCRFSSPHLPLRFPHGFRGAVPAEERAAPLSTGCGVPKTLELGTTEYRPRYPRKALEIRFLNCVLKPVFPCNPVRGFKERICSPAAQGLGSKSSRTPVSLYVPLRKRTPCGVLPANGDASAVADKSARSPTPRPPRPAPPLKSSATPNSGGAIFRDSIQHAMGPAIASRPGDRSARPWRASSSRRCPSFVFSNDLAPLFTEKPFRGEAV